jgi:hypothetical protein
MRRYEYAVMLCLLWLACVIMSGDIGMALLTSVGEPLLGPFINVMVSLNYIDARDLSFEYMGRDELDREKAEKAEWHNALYEFYDKKQWTFIVDSEEEYQEEYAAYGMESELARDFDYENNILLITISRPLSSVRIMEHYTGWKDGRPYASPEFTYKNEEWESSAIYFHSLPRIELKYKNRDGGIITSKLSLWKTKYDDKEDPPNSVPQTQSVDYIGFAKKWIWAFKYFNQ